MGSFLQIFFYTKIYNTKVSLHENFQIYGTYMQMYYVVFLLQFQRKVEESEKKFQSAQGRLEELAALKKRISDMEKNNKSLEASKEVLHIHHVP